MHALKNWLDCDDPQCRCNEHLAKLPPVKPFVTERVSGPSSKVKRTEADRQRAKKAAVASASRMKAWREKNRERHLETQRKASQAFRDRAKAGA